MILFFVSSSFFARIKQTLQSNSSKINRSQECISEKTEKRGKGKEWKMRQGEKRNK
jgi:hypothetical protein